MADSDADVFSEVMTGASQGAASSAWATNIAEQSVRGVPRAPRVMADVLGGGSAPAPSQAFLMRGTRTASPAGPVTWLASGVPDYAGTQYTDGPGALNLSTVATAAVL